MIISYVIGIGCSFIMAAIISFFWVRGIDNMKKNYPDYKGEDFLNWGNDDKKSDKKESGSYEDLEKLGRGRSKY